MEARPLEPDYAIAFFNWTRIKIRVEGAVKNKAVYLMLAGLRLRRKLRVRGASHSHCPGDLTTCVRRRSACK